MCRYANVFIPGKTIETIKIPECPSGLQASSAEGIIQTDFSTRLQGKEGVFLTLHDGHCLYQFNEWAVFFRFIEEIRAANQLDAVSTIVFWSDSRYESLDTTIIDVELGVADEKPKEGVVFRVQVAVPERLSRSIGKHTKVVLKSGKTLSGTLEVYDETAKYGTIRADAGKDPVYFNEGEVRTVSLPEYNGLG